MSIQFIHNIIATVTNGHYHYHSFINFIILITDIDITIIRIIVIIVGIFSLLRHSYFSLSCLYISLQLYTFLLLTRYGCDSLGGVEHTHTHT